MEASPWASATQGWEGERQDGDEGVRLPRAADASRVARVWALPPLPRPPRPALARARAAAPLLVPQRTRPLAGRPAGLHATTPSRGLRARSSVEAGATPAGPRGEEGKAPRGGGARARPAWWAPPRPGT